jgi:hypothetical protein
VVRNNRYESIRDVNEFTDIVCDPTDVRDDLLKNAAEFKHVVNKFNSVMAGIMSLVREFKHFVIELISLAAEVRNSVNEWLRIECGIAIGMNEEIVIKCQGDGSGGGSAFTAWRRAGWPVDCGHDQSRHFESATPRAAGAHPPHERAGDR